MLTVDGMAVPLVAAQYRLMADAMDIQQLTRPTTDSSAFSSRHMWIVTGPAGCGKSTVAESLAQKLSVQFIEGDDLHPASNRKKMEAGIPLNDQDRWDWLVKIREAAVMALDSPSAESTTLHRGVVITCSALKRKYRDVLRVAAYNDHRVHVHFVYLHAPEDVLTERVRNRKSHFMAASMVHSQFAALEEPDDNERRMDVLPVDCSGDPTSVEQDVWDRVQDVLDRAC